MSLMMVNFILRNFPMGKLTHWAAFFAVIAAFAALLGFGGGAGAAAPVAKVLFWASVTIIGVTLIAQAVRKA